ncbi:MAG: 1-acyl-sn-glycerol-3-phosphate acyltransferase [Prevotellaceae bacterium]|nr:1-acyl-sn-glycerol-3-phosphate acyltransferase [Prevotellaceae bacterium]
MLTFIPMAVGWIWILGLMHIFGLKFNIVNIILATFIFGQGDDYTIFVTEGLIYEYSYRKKMLASFKTSIMLSATILFIAIGMLIFAKHPAMRSLAELTMVGMVSVVLCAYLLPPLIYKWLVYAKGKNRIMPITLWNLVKTGFSFTVFLVCSIIVTLGGFFILTIGGKARKNKLLYHNILCQSFKILAKWMPQVKYKIHNPHGETFNKPAVIICNHQSHLDLLYTLLLSPKVITLTNKWVWKSPFYGWIIRYADFLPIADGMEQNIDKLRAFTDDGYSILVFPEGTRSPDCSIGRFHKGAFYLAGALQLDILPIVIHGVRHVLPKQEFLLRKGEVNVFIEQRIVGKEKKQTEDLELLNIAKDVRKLYQKRYAEAALQIETPDYLADKVLKNYIYKGAAIEKAARKSLKKHKNFVEQIAKLPENGEVTIQNIGYGEYALMAALAKKNLKIAAVEVDLDKLEIAKNCADVPENLVFVHKLHENESHGK